MPVVADTRALQAELRRRRGPVVAFDLASMGEWQFMAPVVRLYAARHPEAAVVLVHQRDTIEAFIEAEPELGDRFIHVRRSALNEQPCRAIDLFLTSEQYDLGLDGVYSITMFHGHAAKGLSFVPDVIRTFDALFLNGPVHREAFEVFVDDFLGGAAPPHLELFEIGYAKSDALLNGAFSRAETLRSLGLDANRKTILYAPAFNEGASLREHGVELIRVLARQQQYNVIVKLPIDCWQPTADLYATGGVDWFREIRRMEAEFSNLRLYGEYAIDPLLAAADVLVTCISSVSFEFLALGRPVVFVDTPRYFREVLKELFPDKDTASWAQRTTANGGKEFGLVVREVSELPAAIEKVLVHPEDFPLQRERLQTYLLYNRGRGAEAAVAKIEELLGRKARTRRPWRVRRFLEAVHRRAPRPIVAAARNVAGAVRRVLHA